jgi:hypothetical protein
MIDPASVGDTVTNWWGAGHWKTARALIINKQHREVVRFSRREFRTSCMRIFIDINSQANPSILSL